MAPQDYISATSPDELRELAIADGYALDALDVITTPGPFELEHVSVLYWHSLYMDGDPGEHEFNGDESGDCVNWYSIGDDDRDAIGFPAALDVTCADGSPVHARYARLASDTRGFYYLSYWHGLGAEYQTDVANYAPDDDDDDAGAAR